MRMMERKINRKRVEVFLEFLIFGVAMGLAEDLIALKLATGEPITWKVVGIVTLVAIPFAIAGELIVDRIKIVPNGVDIETARPAYETRSNTRWLLTLDRPVKNKVVQ